MTTTDPIIHLIRQTKGARIALAKKLKITPAAISLWPQVPGRHAYKVAKYLKLHVHVVRPDIFPPPRKPRRINNYGLNNAISDVKLDNRDDA